MTTIVLAAGLSERMGRNKLLLPYKGEAIIVKTVRNALSFSDKVIVVTGNERERVEESLSSFPITFVYNENYIMGQRTSTIEGIKCVENDDFSILPGDLPLLGKEDALNLFEHLGNKGIARCAFKNTPGHPVAYKKEHREKLLAYPGTMKEYLRENGFMMVPSSLGSIYDIDTSDKYEALLESNGDLSILEGCSDISFS